MNKPCDWHLIPGEPDVGIYDCMECLHCGDTRPATDEEVQDSYTEAQYLDELER